MHFRIWTLNFTFETTESGPGHLTSVGIGVHALTTPDAATQRTWCEETLAALEALLDGLFLQPGQTEETKAADLVRAGQKDTRFYEEARDRTVRFTYKGQIPEDSGISEAEASLFLVLSPAKADMSMGGRLDGSGPTAFNTALLERITALPDVVWDDNARTALARLRTLLAHGPSGRANFFSPL